MPYAKYPFTETELRTELRNFIQIFLSVKQVIKIE